MGGHMPDTFAIVGATCCRSARANRVTTVSVRVQARTIPPPTKAPTRKSNQNGILPLRKSNRICRLRRYTNEKHCIEARAPIMSTP
jgi:hypothetical protein